MQKHAVSPQQDAGAQLPISEKGITTIFAEKVGANPVQVYVEEDDQEKGKGHLLVEVLVSESHVLCYKEVKKSI